MFTDIVITAATRTPIGNLLGYYKDIKTTELAAITIRTNLQKNKLSNEQIDEVIMGCVLPAGLGQAPARQAALAADLSQYIPALTINKMCGSGLAAVILAYQAIATANAKVVIAGGMENMTNAPYLLPKIRQGYRFGRKEILDHMMIDGLEDAYHSNQSMGYFAEETAKKYHFSRKMQDEFALMSLSRAKTAMEKGLFNAEIVPVKLTDQTQVTQDEGILTAKPEKIPNLKPAFAKEGTVTAANSSSISDGAASLIVMSQEQAHHLQVQPLAKILGFSSYAHEPAWFTTAPVYAIKKLLAQLNWQVTDVDLFEINEAFAVVVLAAMQELKIPIEKVNVHGGACVLGHPIGASGARILTTLIYALKSRQVKRGIAAICIGGGEALAMAVEVI